MALVSRQSEGGEEAGGAEIPTLLGPGAGGGPGPSGAPKNPKLSGGNQGKPASTPPGQKDSRAADDSDETEDLDETEASADEDDRGPRHGAKALAKTERLQGGTPPVVDYRKIQNERVKKTKPAFFTIYKSGQGYWTRIGTVAGAALLLFFSIYFLYEYLDIWLQWNPATVGTANAPGIPAGPTNPFLVGVTGALIVLMAAYAVGVGTTLALIAGLTGGIAADILCVKGLFGTALTANKSVLLGFVAVYTVAYIVLSYRLMNKPGNVDFLIATDSEMKKVNWTTRAELIGSTKVVILFVILTAIFLFIVDMAFSYLFRLIHVLKVGPFG